MPSQLLFEHPLYNFQETYDTENDDMMESTLSMKEPMKEIIDEKPTILEMTAPPPPMAPTPPMIPMIDPPRKGTQSENICS